MKSVSIIDRKKCFSCRSCVQICPKNAIDMQENNEGFFYPKVNESECIDCGLCLKHCPSFEPYEKNGFKKTSCAVWLKDDKKLFESSSGALFSTVAERILENDGVVFGAAYNNDLFVEQSCIENINELYKLKGSKYVESTTGSTYSEVLSYLKNGKKVLYSGTPCQIAGLKKFLGKDYDNLFTMDLICHGVPSEKLFHKYLDWQSDQLGGKIIYCGFRDKDVGGCSCNGKIKTKTKTKTKTVLSALDPYYSSFIRCETYRESCYSCPYSSLERPGDISMGDFTEITELIPGFDFSKGLSLCIIDTEKGQALFNLVKDSFNIMPLEFSQYISIKSNLQKPSERPAARNFVYSGIEELSVKKFFKRFKESSRFYFIRFYSKKILSKITPGFIKKFVKRTVRGKIK
ncbi:MAG: Coenzyme F420 hydrogenase/dehydrogenase, beta subunit C-terminal domain [Treponema sp.]|nr:Coenzyme F420 hydrogenase/dehydrogenase, beta subunit C-terminal domain [Treponema sp.]